MRIKISFKFVLCVSYQFCESIIKCQVKQITLLAHLIIFSDENA